MKTSVIISAVLIGVSAIAFAAKKNPVMESKSIEPEDFYELIVNNNSNIILNQGEQSGVRIEGDKNSLNQVRVHVHDGALIIDGSGNFNPNIYITVKDISLIEINGGAKIYGTGTINSDILLLKTNGTGSMKLDVKTLKLAMYASSGKIIVSGSTGESVVRESHTGKVYDRKLYSFARATPSNHGQAKNQVMLQP
jgi:hypothetical protein